MVKLIILNELTKIKLKNLQSLSLFKIIYIVIIFNKIFERYYRFKETIIAPSIYKN